MDEWDISQLVIDVESAYENKENELPRLSEEVDRMMALLSCIEWSRDQDVCPWCNYKSASGHHEDCTVDLALHGEE